MKNLQKGLQGSFYDLEYSIEALSSMKDSEQHVKNVQELLKNAVFVKQQIDYVESLKPKPEGEKSTKAASVSKRKFHRFSGSFDLPSSFIPQSISTVSSSASSDFRDIKSIISNMTTSSSTRKSRTGSLSISSSSGSSDVLSNDPNVN